jgi:hypothetical protein
MNIDLRPFMVLEALLAATVIAMIVWRRSVARNEDDNLHVLHAEALPQQVAVAKKLDVIDKWGKALTVIAVVFGLLLGAAYLYQVWVQGSNLPTGA